MAIRKVSEGVATWNSSMPFPNDRYTVRCIEEVFGLSKSSGNPMITRTFEIVCPNQVEFGGRKMDIDGLKVTQYRVVKAKVSKESDEWDIEKSNKKFGELCDELKVAGFDGEEVDDENPPLFFLNKTFDAYISAKGEPRRKAPTAEQAKAGVPGDTVKDGNGKDVISYQLQVGQILGPSTVETGRVY